MGLVALVQVFWPSLHYNIDPRTLIRQQYIATDVYDLSALNDKTQATTFSYIIWDLMKKTLQNSWRPDPEEIFSICWFQGHITQPLSTFC